MRVALSLLLLCCTTILAGDEGKPFQAEAVEKLKEHTSQELPQLRKRVARAPAALKRTLNRDIKDCVEGKAFLTPLNLEPANLQPGTIGIPWVHEARVLEIVDDQTVVMQFYMKGRQGPAGDQWRKIRMANFPTRNLTTDTILRFGWVDNRTKPHPVIYVTGARKHRGDTILEAIIVDLPEGSRVLTDGFAI